MKLLLILLVAISQICAVITSSCISSDGVYLVVGDSEGLISFYNTSKLKEPIWTFKSKYDDSSIIELEAAIRDSAYYFAAATQKGSLIFLDGSRKTKISELESMGEIQALIVQPALELQFLSYSSDGIIWSFNSRTARYIGSRTLPGKPFIREMDYSPNLKEFVFITLDGRAHFINAGNLVERETLMCCRGKATQYATSSDTRWIAFSTNVGKIEVYEYTSLDKVGKRRITKLPITALTYKPSSTLLIAGDVDGGVHFWDHDSKFILHCEGHTSAIIGIHYYAEGKMITISDNGECLVWDVGNAEVINKFVFPTAVSP